MLTTGEAVAVYDLLGDRPPVMFPALGEESRANFWDAAAHIAFSPDGSQIAVGVADAVAVHYSETGDLRFRAPRLRDHVSRVAFDPAGVFLYSGTHAGMVVAHRTDLFNADRTVVLRTTTDTVRDLAVSPDGETLFTTGSDGVRLWPIRRLLDGT